MNTYTRIDKASRLLSLASPQSRGLQRKKVQVKSNSGKTFSRTYWVASTAKSQQESRTNQISEDDIKNGLSHQEYTSYRNLKYEQEDIESRIEENRDILNAFLESVSIYRGQAESAAPGSEDHEKALGKIKSFEGNANRMKRAVDGLQEALKENKRRVEELTAHIYEKGREKGKATSERPSAMSKIKEEDIEKGLQNGILPFDHRNYIVDGSPLAQSELDAIDSVMDSQFKTDRAKAKIQRTSPEITTQEAKSLAFYMEGSYEEMNRVMREDIGMERRGGKLIVNGETLSGSIEGLPQSETGKMIAMSKAATQALEKMPVFSPESLRSSLMSDHKLNFLGRSQEERVEKLLTSEDWQIERSKDGKITVPPGKGQLHRYIDVEESVLEQFAEKNKPGAIIRDDGFTSTAVPLSGHNGLLSSFNKGNVLYKIDWKKDGTTKGRYVDHVKKSLLEFEVLYMPRTEFKVRSVAFGDGAEFNLELYKERKSKLKKMEKSGIPLTSDKYLKAFYDAKLTIEMEEM